MLDRTLPFDEQYFLYESANREYLVIVESLQAIISELKDITERDNNAEIEAIKQGVARLIEDVKQGLYIEKNKTITSFRGPYTEYLKFAKELLAKVKSEIEKTKSYKEHITI